MCSKIVRLTVIRNGPKRTIYASDGLGLLQIVSEPDISQCANEDADPQRGWIVRSHMSWRGERSIPVETSLVDAF